MTRDELGEKGIKRSVQLRVKNRFELTQSVPELDPGVAMHLPRLPGNVSFVEGWGLGVAWMSNERESTRVVDSVDQRLRVICQRGDVPVGVEHQEMILVRVTILVMDLLPNQKQN